MNSNLKGLSKISLIMLSMIAFFMLSGCSVDRLKKSFVPDSNYFTDTTPTVESLSKTNHNVQIYRKTAFFPKDFKSNGELKSIYDYDFANEDAPCTVLGDTYHESPIFKEAYYTVKAGEAKSFVFQCRPTSDVVHARHFRLFMIGTYHECNSRRFDYSSSLLPDLREYGSQCAMGFKTKTNTIIESEYKDAFSKHSGITSKKL